MIDFEALKLNDPGACYLTTFTNNPFDDTVQVISYANSPLSDYSFADIKLNNTPISDPDQTGCRGLISFISTTQTCLFITLS